MRPIEALLGVVERCSFRVSAASYRLFALIPTDTQLGVVDRINLPQPPIGFLLLILRLSVVLDLATSRFSGDAKLGVDVEFTALTGDAGLPGLVRMRTGGVCATLAELLSIGAAPGRSNCVCSCLVEWGAIWIGAS